MIVLYLFVKMHQLTFYKATLIEYQKIIEPSHENIYEAMRKCIKHKGTDQPAHPTVNSDQYLCCRLSRNHDISSFYIRKCITVKFLNFLTPEIFAVVYLKLEQRGQTLRLFRPKDANGIANSEDPDQTAPLGAV